jgi:hypothetical protein
MGLVGKGGINVAMVERHVGTISGFFICSCSRLAMFRVTKACSISVASLNGYSPIEEYYNMQ